MFEKKSAEYANGERASKTKEQFDFESALESIDFEGLRSVFREKLEALGLESEGMSFVEKERVKDMSSFFLAGEYSLKEKAITVNVHMAAFLERSQAEREHIFGPGSLLEKLLEEPKRNRDLFESIFLSVLCHEEAHAVSHRECPELTPIKGLPFIKIKEGGIGIQRIPHYVVGKRLFTLGKDHRAFLLFNEAITDKVGEEVFHEYRKRCKKSAEGKSAGEGGAEKYTPGYKKGRFLVETVLEKIAEECDIEADMVWKSLQRGFFLNEALDGDFVKRLFGQVAPSHLLSDIRYSGMGFLDLPSLALAVVKIRKRKWSEKDKKRVRRWFKEEEIRRSNVRK